MNKKLFYLLLAIVMVLPMTLFAGSRDDCGWDIFNGRNISSCKHIDGDVEETPIVAPLQSTMDPKYGEDMDYIRKNLWPNPLPGTDLTKRLGPYKLFDNLYYIGTQNVGVHVVKTSKGLILIDAGWGLGDCVGMMEDLVKLGLKPRDIKMILVSHEHIDHYGCVNEWKKGFCPSAKVGLTRIGWDWLRARPVLGGTDEPRPDSIDTYLTDGQHITLGDTTIELVYTPGHSPGCISFIIPVKDRGKKHVVGLVGGTAAPGNFNENFLYWASVARFKQECEKAKCDVGLTAHYTAPNAYGSCGNPSNYVACLNKLATRSSHDPNPLVIGTERFDSEYLQSYRDKVMKALNGLRTTNPEKPPIPLP
jgi:metallo-beta-lactamase class B